MKILITILAVFISSNIFASSSNAWKTSGSGNSAWITSTTSQDVVTIFFDAKNNCKANIHFLKYSNNPVAETRSLLVSNSLEIKIDSNISRVYNSNFFDGIKGNYYTTFTRPLNAYLYNLIRRGNTLKLILDNSYESYYSLANSNNAILSAKNRCLTDNAETKEGDNHNNLSSENNVNLSSENNVNFSNGTSSSWMNENKDILSVYVSAILAVMLLIYVLMGIYKNINNSLKKTAGKLDTSPTGAFFTILFLPATILLGILFGILKPIYIFFKPLLNEIYYLAIGFLKILFGFFGVVIQIGKNNTSKPVSVLNQLEYLSIKSYRNYANRNNIAPTIKTSDSEIINVVKQVQSAFIDAAERRGEHISGTHLMTINVYFLQKYEDLEYELFTRNLEYEVNKYFNEGLREEYKKDLGVL